MSGANAGAELRPSGRPPRGRRWLRYIPLFLVLIAGAGSLVVGQRVHAQEMEHVVPKPAAMSTSVAADVCRPPVAAPTSEPWLRGDGSAEKTWDAHATEVGKPYVIGPNGWIFWSDYIESYASQAVGRATLSSAEVQQWVDYYTSIRNGLAAQGIKFYVIVTPSTSSVYPEELPTWMQDVRGSTIMDQVMAASGDLPIIDLRQPLIDAKTPDTHLFSWDNSHWTDYGGYIGWKSVAACVNTLHPDDAPLQVPSISGTEITGDFNEWAPFGVASPGADWSVPVYRSPLQDVTVNRNGQSETDPGDGKIDSGTLPATTTVPDSWTGESALIVRDSMGNSLSPYWDQAYSPTWQYLHQWDSYQDWPDYRQLVAEHHPDVVIVQLAERHLVNPPPAGAHY